MLVSGMQYQKLVDATTGNTREINQIRAVDVALMGSINEMTRAVAGLTATVQHLNADINRLEDDVRRD
jgi:hypothetical protein